VISIPECPAHGYSKEEPAMQWNSQAQDIGNR
jgi:hypothetical protein